MSKYNFKKNNDYIYATNTSGDDRFSIKFQNNILEVKLYGIIHNLIQTENEEAAAAEKEGRFYIRRSDELFGSDKQFNDCMSKYGFEETMNEYGARSYIYFKGDPSKEILIKITDKGVETDELIVGGFTNRLFIYSFKVSAAYFEDEGEYTGEVLIDNWEVIAESFYKAIVSYLKDEDCSGKRVKLKSARENALNDYYRRIELKGDRTKEEERVDVLIKKSAKYSKKEKKDELNLENISNYNSNVSSISSSNNTNLKLISYFLKKDVPYQFLIASKKMYEDKIASEGTLIDSSDILERILIPSELLAVKKFMCLGINYSYIKISIKKSDIVLLLYEQNEKKDDTYIAGIATLIVKDNAIEIDLICSQLGYKMAGRLLMNKVIKIAKKLGKEKVELLSVGNPDTIQFYKRLQFKKVKSSNEFAKQGTRKRLIAFRRRITSKKPAGGKSASKDAASEPAGKPAGGKSASKDAASEPAGKPAGGKSASKDAASEPAGKPAGGAGRSVSKDTALETGAKSK